jgi:hypothetical protein
MSHHRHHARTRHHHHVHRYAHHRKNFSNHVSTASWSFFGRAASYRSSQGSRPAGCPHAWCGCFLALELGMHDARLNVARNWASVGTNAGGPGIGVIVVWRHHVGRIVGGSPGAWVVRSGNDGNRVRERVFPMTALGGAIAYRRV